MSKGHECAMVFIEKEMQLTYKHLKKYKNSLTIRKIKTKIGYYFSPIKLTKTKNFIKHFVFEDMGKQAFS